jgi:leucyl-tRNA synthetase
VNGKLRGTVEVGKEVTQDQAVTAALTVPSVAKFLGEKEIKKIVFVPGRILNFIVGK